MQAFDLYSFLKSLFLSTSEPLAVKGIQNLITQYHAELVQEDEDSQGCIRAVPNLLTASQIRNAIDDINEKLEASHEVYRIAEVLDGFQLVIIPAYAPWVRLLRSEPKPLKLSQALLETLTIIAYKQPITRAELEAIRGVSVDNALQKLNQLELIYISGRAELPGRPMQYATGKKFLELCGLRSLEELPKSDLIPEGHLESWLAENTQGAPVFGNESVGFAASATPLDLPFDRSITNTANEQEA
jgi:segregation and condensation protein B